MDFLQVLVVLLGLAMIVCLLYLVLSGKPVPPELKMIVLIGVGLMLLFCLGHAIGCRVPTPVVR